MRCEIQWIDCHGEPTPDCNLAIGYAVSTIRTFDGETDIRSFPICAEHLATMRGEAVHHDSDCKHVRSNVHSGFSNWTFEPFEPFPCIDPVKEAWPRLVWCNGGEVDVWWGGGNCGYGWPSVWRCESSGG